MTDEPYCPSGKIIFETLKAAIAAANQMRRHIGNKTKAYKCNSCPWYHVTTRYKDRYDGMRRTGKTRIKKGKNRC